MKTLKKTLFIAAVTMGTFFLTSCENEAIEASPEDVQTDDAQDAAVRDVTIFYNGKSFKTTEGGGQDIDLSVLDAATRKAYDEASALHLPDEIYLFETQEEFNAFEEEKFPELLDRNDAANNSSRVNPWNWDYGVQSDADFANKWGEQVYLNIFAPFNQPKKMRVQLKDENWTPRMSVWGSEINGVVHPLDVRYIGDDFNNRTTYVTMPAGNFNSTERTLDLYDGKFGGKHLRIALPRGMGKRSITNRRISLSGGVSSFKYYQDTFGPQ